MKILTSLFQKMWHEFKKKTRSNYEFEAEFLYQYVQIPFEINEQLFENSFDSDQLNNLEFKELSIKFLKEKFEN